MSVWVEDSDKILNICEEVLEKTKNMQDALKRNYIVVLDSGCVNAYNYFLLPFENIVSIIRKERKDHGMSLLSSDMIYKIIYHDYKVKLIIKITPDHETLGILPTTIYTSKENGEQLFTIDRENKTVYKQSSATYVDTPFDLMLTIVLNGLRAILENLNYVTDSEILEYANNRLDERDRTRDIVKRIIEIIKERTNGN